MAGNRLFAAVMLCILLFLLPACHDEQNQADDDSNDDDSVGTDDDALDDDLHDDDSAPDDDVTDDDSVDDDSIDDDSADDDSIDDDSADDDSADDDTTDDDFIDDDTADDDSIDDDSVDDDSADDDTTDDDSVDDDSADDDTVMMVDCYVDADRDGQGVAGLSQSFELSCPIGWSETFDDCDDADPLVFPGAPELPGDGIDQDCSAAAWAGTNDLEPSDTTGIFVAKTGNNGNPGTMAAPKLTIAAGIAAAHSAGKVVFVAEGEYIENVEATVSVFGGYEATSWTRDIAGHETIILAASTTTDPSVAVHATGAQPLALQGLTIRGNSTDSYTVGLQSSAVLLVAADNFIHGGNPPVDGMNMNHATGVDVLSGLAILARNSINGGHPKWAYRSGVEGVLSSADAVILLFGNEIYGGSCHGYSLGADVVGVLVEGPSIFWNNGVDGGDVSCSNTACFAWGVDATTHTEFLNNTIYGGDTSAGSEPYSGSSWALYLRDGDYAAELVVAGNVIAGGVAFSGGNSIGLTLYGTAAEYVVVNNIVSGGKGGDEDVAFTGGSSDLIAIHNTFLSSAVGSNSYSAIVVGGGGTFINNQFVRIGTHENGSVLNLIDSETTTRLINNNFVAADADCLLFSGTPGSGFCVKDIAGVNDASQWYGEESTGNIEVDPLFVDPANGDYHLGAGSLCIDAGVDPAPWYENELYAYDLDGDARPLGDGWDIGADEYHE